MEQNKRQNGKSQKRTDLSLQETQAQKSFSGAKLGKKISNWLLCGGISSGEYKDIRPIIERKNRETLFLASLLCTLMFTGLLIACLYSSSIKDAEVYYCIMTVACACIAVLSATIAKAHTKLVLWLWYVLFVFFGAYAVLLNTIMRPNISSTTLCAFLVAGPLLIIDRPVRVATYMVGLSAVFIVLAHSSKDAYIAFADSVNVVCCSFIGIAIYMRIVRIKLNDIIKSRLLERERDTDKLTDVLNKAAIARKIREHLLAPDAEGTFVILDLDDFKYINDTFGHAFGDVVLRFVAECIRKEAPVLCGRFGGDEFLVFLSETGDAFAAKMESLTRRFQEKIQYPVEGGRFSISAGAASVPNDAKDYDTLFQKADCALYAAKHAGKNCWFSYSEELNH